MLLLLRKMRDVVKYIVFLSLFERMTGLYVYCTVVLIVIDFTFCNTIVVVTFQLTESLVGLTLNTMLIILTPFYMKYYISPHSSMSILFICILVDNSNFR